MRERRRMGKFEVEAAIDVLANDFANGLAGLVTGDWLREGVLKEGVTAVIWALYGAMPDQREALAEATENWPDLIRDAIADQSAKQQDTES